MKLCYFESIYIKKKLLIKPEIVHAETKFLHLSSRKLKRKLDEKSSSIIQQTNENFLQRYFLETYLTTVRYFAHRGRSFHEHIANMTLVAQPLDSNVDDGSGNVNLKRQL
ncbi:hypothetical protein Anas_01811 [Armadillidium nasatum]|uniref:Uncharacterized protein n=1 Tax=Armadillidium nasatum TaxID=96803 RepID=A0A5N5SQN8_9CRUS|nr:hypothetical protein Anas_01811 [Armadillidium nasatum]